MPTANPAPLATPLGEVLNFKFPKIDPLNGGWDVRDDGSGAYISYWDVGTTGIAQPDAATLSTWEQDYNSYKQTGEFKAASFDVETKIIAALIRKAKHDQLGTTPPQWVTDTLTAANNKLTGLGVP